MNVYFACSIAGGRERAHVYKDIIGYIEGAGANVLSKLFADPNLKSELGTDPNITPRFIWSRDCNWAREADAIIAEVTQPSLGVGYEISLAETLGTPVLALFYKDSGRRLSPMLSGNPHVQLFEYKDIKEAEDIIKTFLKTSPHNN